MIGVIWSASVKLLVLKYSQQAAAKNDENADFVWVWKKLIPRFGVSDLKQLLYTLTRVYLYKKYYG